MGIFQNVIRKSHKFFAPLIIIEFYIRSMVFKRLKIINGVGDEMQGIMTMESSNRLTLYLNVFIKILCLIA